MCLQEAKQWLPVCARLGSKILIFSQDKRISQYSIVSNFQLRFILNVFNLGFPIKKPFFVKY